MISLTLRHEADNNNITDIWDPCEGESTVLAQQTLNRFLFLFTNEA